MIRIRVSERDINFFLARPGVADIRYDDGTFTVVKKIAVVTVEAKAHLDFRDDKVRVAIPFRELGTAHTGSLLGSFAATLWPRVVEPWLEKKIADQLAARGLPWDLVWVDTVDDPERGRVGTINFSPQTLNEWLRQKGPVAGLVPRLVALDLSRTHLTIGLRLVPAGEAAPTWRSELQPSLTEDGNR